ncbi:MAG: DUF2066 domain-containing protein [Gammaproteobacteria bacterium]|nr:DUF2066 domain-containing protein [Gammaproteobacteria bacterium]MCF6231012.1 DUF2066 domain-containing protein [Gammaproteobacteria bacterium]
MNRLFYLFSLLWCGLFYSGVQAATVEGLYEAEVPVARQTDSERSRVLPLAFQQVLIKVVGQHQLDPDVVKALSRKASRFTQQFRFKVNPEWRKYQDALTAPTALGWTSSNRSDDDQLAGEADAVAVPPEPYLLWVRFGESTVNQALMDAALPIWGKERPALLLWLVIEQSGERILLGGELLPELQSQVVKISQQRGVPLWLPLLDFQDQQSIAVGDLMGGFEEPVLEASKRYQPDKIAVGRLHQLNETVWRTQWRLLGDDQSSVIYQESAGLEAGLEEGLNLLLDQLGERFAQYLDVNQKNKIVLRVHGVTDLAAYARVTEYLSSLDVVKSVFVKEASEGTLLVELEALGDRGVVERLLALGRQLHPLVSGSDPFESEIERHYQLSP